MNNRSLWHFLCPNEENPSRSCHSTDEGTNTDVLSQRVQARTNWFFNAPSTIWPLWCLGLTQRIKIVQSQDTIGYLHMILEAGKHMPKYVSKAHVLNILNSVALLLIKQSINLVSYVYSLSHWILTRVPRHPRVSQVFYSYMTIFWSTYDFFFSMAKIQHCWERSARWGMNCISEELGVPFGHVYKK